MRAGNLHSKKTSEFSTVLFWVIAILAISFYFQTSQAHAATYYVDSVGGLNSNTGLSSSVPWQTIAKVNSSTFNPGDNILFKSGDTWRESLVPPSSGISGTPITFGSYGTGAKPVIDGKMTVTGWSSNGGSSENEGNNATGTEFHPINTILYTKIRTTDGGTLQNYNAYFGSGTLPTHVKFAMYSDAGDIPGDLLANSQSAEIVPSSGWNTATVTSGTVLAAATNYWEAYWISSFADNAPAAGSLGSNLQTLAYGSWPTTANSSGWDTSNGGFFATASIAGASNTWKATVVDQPFEVWIDGVSLGAPVTSLAGLTSNNKWYWSAGVLYIYSTSDPSSGHTIEVDRKYPIYVSQVNYITLKNIEVKNGNNADIYLRGSTYDIVQNMTVHDAYYEGVYVGIGGGGHVIENSEIYNTGLAGTFGTGSGIQLNGEEAPPVTIPSIVQNNYIHDLGDPVGGDHAIYDEVAGDIDRYNYIKNVVGGGTAIKADGNGILIYENIFDTDPSGGVYMDSYSNVKIDNNTFYNTGSISPYGGITFNGDGAETGVEFKNNIFFLPGNGYSAAIVINASDTTGFSSDYNIVYGSGVWWGETGNGNDYDSLASWQSGTGQDAHSKFANPRFISSSNFALASSSPAIDAGGNLGTQYQLALDPASTFPSNILTVNQNSLGTGWDIGAYAYTQTTKPVVTFTNPGVSVTGTIILAASSSASAPAAISSVAFYLDGSLLGQSSSSPYSYSWNTASSTNASHTLFALATDNYGNTASSSVISVTVSNAVAATSTPTSTPITVSVSGGGGGGGYIPPQPVATTTASSSPSTSITPTSTPISSSSSLSSLSTSSLQAMIDSLMEELQALEAQAGIASSLPPAFTRDLTVGSRGLDVKALQHYLNTHGFPVMPIPTYAGSLGYETQYFGIATEQALSRFQASVGIVPASGYFGPITRGWIGGGM